MSIFKLFSGPSWEKLKQKGDTLVESGSWGQAKQVYEEALYKLEKQTEPNAGDIRRLSEKIGEVRERLARDHQKTALNYMEGGHHDDARQFFELALEISKDESFRQKLNGQIKGMMPAQPQRIEPEQTDIGYEDEDHETYQSLEEDIDDDEYFHALCGPLPEAVQDAYLEYGDDFRAGFIALNRGDFQAAAESLPRAMTQNPEPDSYIPLELAAAYLNLGRLDEAQALLQGFLSFHPDALPAYQLLCEIYWEKADYIQVDALLASVPEEVSGSLAVVLMKGESRLRAGDYEGARDFYQDMLENYGWNDTVAGALAKSCEALGESENARKIYKEMMDRCNSCHARVDPMIKHRYAELCFASGDYDTEILELYLALTHEIPGHAVHYYDRISRIYAAQGNTVEAERFRSFCSVGSSE